MSAAARLRLRRRSLACWAFLGLAAATPALAGGSSDQPAFKILVGSRGVYKVSFEDLAGVGLGAPAPAACLTLSAGGEEVPLWLEDGGDGSFGPGDWLEFVGEGLRGDGTYYDEFSAFNVYRLACGDGAPRRMRPGGDQPGPAEVGRNPQLTVRRHLEDDRLLLRFAPRDGEDREQWYWARLSHQDRPLTLALDTEALDRESARPVELRIELRGWSKPRHHDDGAPTDHRVEILLNGQRVGEREWQAQDVTLIELALPAAALRPAGNELAIAVPVRRAAADADPLIDVVVLNWIEISYPRLPSLGARPLEVWTAAEPAGAATMPARLVSSQPRSLVVYTADGLRLDASSIRQKTRANGTTVSLFHLPAGGGERLLLAVPDGKLAAPAGIEPDRPSQLRDPDQQADYIVIAHRSLLAGAERLARFHRDRGLRVAVVDVEDVYDEFNHGVLTPRAIRDFLIYAANHWRPPAPRYVLLVGDASWDTKNALVEERNYVAWTYQPGSENPFPVTLGTPYEEGAQANDRNLVPSWSYLTFQGHAASDNYFADLDGDDYPDLAIGRLPVTEPDEVEAIVDKTMRYATRSKVGPWRRSILWISDGDSQQDRLSDEVASGISLRGYAAVKLKPAAGELVTDEHRRSLREAIDRGQLVVHFLGHGGRFIWRTAPADLEQNRDLFTLEDVDALANGDRLPVVVSMTCYSAPFDHPSSDSIGERFLRDPGRGAVAVIAASWRNSPTQTVSETLMTELTRGGTVGEALMRAKRQTRHRYFIQLYNLLGDPALPLAVPAQSVAVELLAAGAVRAHLDGGPWQGRAIVDWLDAAGEVLGSREVPLAGPVLELPFPGAAATAGAVRAARVYAWDEGANRDGLGVAERGVPAAVRAEAETTPQGSGTQRDDKP